METVLPSGYVGRELVPVLAVVATHVAFKRITEPMAAHVDRIHHVIQEKDSTMFTLVNPYLLPIAADHFESILGIVSTRSQDIILPVFFFYRDAISCMSTYVVCQVDQTTALLIIALCICRVLAAVAGRDISFRGDRLGFGKQQQVFHCAVLREAGANLIVPKRFVELIHGADDRHHLRAPRRCLDQGTQGLCPQVADGVVDGLVDHVCLHELVLLLVVDAGIVWKIGQTFVTCSEKQRGVRGLIST